MAANDIELRRLVIKAFHMTEVEMGDENKITTSGKMTINIASMEKYTDELVGKKGDAALTDSAQELFFNLIDGAYSGERKAKLWILGNFYKGAIDNLVADPEPYKRRIRACFRPALFKLNKDESDVTVTQNITIS